MLAFIYFFIFSINLWSFAFTVNPRLGELSNTPRNSNPEAEKNDSSEMNVRISHNMNLLPLQNAHKTKRFDNVYKFHKSVKNNLKVNNRSERRRKDTLMNSEFNNLLSNKENGMAPNEFGSAIQSVQEVPQMYHENEENTKAVKDSEFQQFEPEISGSQNGEIFIPKQYPNKRLDIPDNTLNDIPSQLQEPNIPLTRISSPLDIKGSESKENRNSETIGNNDNDKLKDMDILDSIDYRNGILLRKTKKVEILIKNQNSLAKLLQNAMDGDIYPVFKKLNEQPITLLYDSNFRNPQSIPIDSITSSVDTNFQLLPTIDGKNQQNKMFIGLNPVSNLAQEKILVNKDPLFEKYGIANKNKIPLNEFVNKNIYNVPNDVSDNRQIINEHENQENKPTFGFNPMESQSKEQISVQNESPLLGKYGITSKNVPPEELVNKNLFYPANGLIDEKALDAYLKNGQQTKFKDMNTNQFNIQPDFKTPNNIPGIVGTGVALTNEPPNLNPVYNSEIKSPIPPESHLMYKVISESPYIQEQVGKLGTGMKDELQQPEQGDLSNFPSNSVAQLFGTPTEPYVQYGKEDKSTYVQEQNRKPSIGGMRYSIPYETHQANLGTFATEIPMKPLLNLQTPPGLHEPLENNDKLNFETFSTENSGQVLGSLPIQPELQKPYENNKLPYVLDQQSKPSQKVKDGGLHMPFENNNKLNLETFTTKNPGQAIGSLPIQTELQKPLESNKFPYGLEQQSKPSEEIKDGGLHVPLNNNKFPYVLEQQNKPNEEIKDGRQHVPFENNNKPNLETFITENTNEPLWSLQTLPVHHVPFEKNKYPYVLEQQDKPSEETKGDVFSESNQIFTQTFTNFPSPISSSGQLLWTPQTLANEATTKRFVNLTELEELPLKYKNVSQSFLLREQTEYVSSSEQEPTSTTLRTTLTTQSNLNEAEETDYNAKHPPVETGVVEDKEIDPKMIRMHIKPFSKKKHKLEERLKRYQELKRKTIDSNSSIPKKEAAGAGHTRNRRAIDGGKPIDQRRPHHGCCHNGGTCIVGGRTGGHGSSGNRCICSPSYTGRYCETKVNSCLNVVCKEHEVCESSKGTCTCSSDFVREGNDCIPAVTCEEFPCLNGADCEDLENGGFKCLCPLGYLGKTCNIRVPECEDSSCSNDEICVSTETGYECVRKERSG